MTPQTENWNINLNCRFKRQQKLDSSHRFRFRSMFLPSLWPLASGASFISPRLLSVLVSADSLLKILEKSVWRTTDVTSCNSIGAMRITSNVLFWWPWWVHTPQACFTTWVHCQEMFLACKQRHPTVGEGSTVLLGWECKYKFIHRLCGWRRHFYVNRNEMLFLFWGFIV